MYECKLALVSFSRSWMMIAIKHAEEGGCVQEGGTWLDREIGHNPESQNSVTNSVTNFGGDGEFHKSNWSPGTKKMIRIDHQNWETDVFL